MDRQRPCHPDNPFLRAPNASGSNRSLLQRFVVPVLFSRPGALVLNLNSPMKEAQQQQLSQCNQIPVPV